jgi:uncharacterized protein
LRGYQNPDGSTRREYRPPEEVFKADSVESFAVVPLTNDHPPEGMLTSENTKKHQVGMVQAPKQDGSYLRAKLVITDAQAIADLESGKQQLSCGYTADLEETPGVTPEGEHYDCVQRNISANHVALVSFGRAGPDVRVRVDSGAAIMVGSQHLADSSRNRSETMMKIRFDQAELEVTEDVAKAIEAERTAHADALKKSQAEVSTVSARADAAESEAKKLREDLAAAPARERAAAVARLALEAVVKERLPEVKVDGVSDLDLQKQIVAVAFPDLKLDGKDDAYVSALFDAARTKRAEPEHAPIPHKDHGSPLSKAQAEYFAALPK